MKEKVSFEKASVYQLALRSFTPEGTICAAKKLLPFLARLGPRYIQLVACAKADDDMNQDFWSKRQKASETGNPKNSYRIKDYFTVDEEYGTDEDLKDFVTEAHRLGLKVIWDLVYLHCGPKAVFLEKDPRFVHCNEDGTPKVGAEWPFPQFDYSRQEVREYLWNNMTGLVEKFDFDGYRCDVGDMVPLDFWAEGISRVRKIKPDFFMINEGRNPEYLKFFDANYFYEGCHDAVLVAQGKMTAEEFQEKLEESRKALPPGGRLLRYIDNHDICSDSYEDRHEKTIGNAGVDALLVLDFLLDGVPFLFNGYEVADDLKHNMFSNRFYGRDAAVNWANILCEKGQRRFELLQKLFGMRRETGTLWSTNLIWCKNTAPESVLSFLRPDGEAPLFVAVNMTDNPVSLEVEELPENLHLMKPELLENVRWVVKDGRLYLQMLGFGYLAAFYPA